MPEEEAGADTQAWAKPGQDIYGGCSQATKMGEVIGLSWRLFISSI